MLVILGLYDLLEKRMSDGNARDGWGDFVPLDPCITGHCNSVLESKGYKANASLTDIDKRHASPEDGHR